MTRGGRREGAGRKLKYGEPIKYVLIGLPESLLAKLDNEVKARGLSRTETIRLILADYFNHTI